MKLEEIQASWEKDCIIDRTNLAYESTRTPLLHSKYINKYGSVRLLLRKASTDHLKLKKDKMRYFKGQMTREELAERGWLQYQGREPMKSEMEEYLKTDHDMIRLEDKVEYLKVIEETIDSILKMIKARSWDIRNAIDYEKMQLGIS